MSKKGNKEFAMKGIEMGDDGGVGWMLVWHTVTCTISKCCHGRASKLGGQNVIRICIEDLAEYVDNKDTPSQHACICPDSLTPKYIESRPNNK